MKQYKDIADIPEEDRIGEIGRKTIELKKGVAFITDADPGKKERYIKKLLDRFPQIEVEKTMDGPVKDTVTVFVRVK